MNGFDGSRIYFSPCGMGLGHVSRSVPIAREVVNRGGEVLFSTYLEAVDYVRKFGFPVVSAPPLQMENDATGSVDMKASTIGQSITTIPTFLNQVRFEIQSMQHFDPDIIFSDTRVSTIYAAKILGIPCITILNQFLPRVPREEDNNFYRFIDGAILTVLGRSWALSNMLVIPDFPEPYTISLDSLRIPRRVGVKTNLVGSILNTKPEEVTGVKKLRESLGVEDDEFLIYGGISGPKNEREPLIKLLEPLFEKLAVKYRVVMSLGVAHGGSEPISSNPVIKIPWIENRFQYLKACDLVISRGGHETIMQSICYEKPSIIIPVPKHPEQYGNARRVMELGAGIAMHQRDLSEESLFSNVEELLGSMKYKKKLQKMNRTNLCDGIENTIEAIASQLNA